MLSKSFYASLDSRRARGLPEPEQCVGHVLCNRYLVEELCDETQTSLLLRAYHLALNRQVLLEIMPRRVLGNSTVLEEARSEAIRVSTPTSRCLEVTCLRGRWPVLVYPFRPGVTLSSQLREQGRLPLERVLPLARQIAAAVASAHAVGLGHGSLDLDRLWLQQRTGRVEGVSVLGFGVRRLSSARTVRPPSGVFQRRRAGTQPPGAKVELVRTEVQDDLRRIGQCLSELVCGPSANCVDAGQVPAVLNGNAHAAVEKAFARILRRCLHPGSENAYGSVREFCFDLYRLECTARSLRVEVVTSLPPVTAVHVPARPRGTERRQPKVIVRPAISA